MLIRKESLKFLFGSVFFNNLKLESNQINQIILLQYNNYYIALQLSKYIYMWISYKGAGNLKYL